MARLKDLAVDVEEMILAGNTVIVLAMAVQELFKDTQVTIGPVIENGFYYDFSRKKPFTEEDLLKIEERMREIIDRID